MSRLLVTVSRGTTSVLLLLCTVVLLCCTAAGTAALALQLTRRDHAVVNSSNNTSHDTARRVQTRYIVVFDFGSSGNRAHVYRFTQTQAANAATAATATTAATALPQHHADKDVYAALLSRLHGVDVVEELYIHDTSPLHTAATPAAAVTAVQLLLYRVMAHIPSALHSDTLVAYCATAGLRLAKQQQEPQARRDGGYGVVVAADVLLQVLHEQLSQSTTLRVTRDAHGRAVQLLDGDEEAALAWLAVNFAHVRAATMTTTATVTTNTAHRQHNNNNSSSSSNAAIIDLGGGSTQVGVLLPRHGRDSNDGNDAITTLTVATAADATTTPPSASSLFARSHDGLGLHAAVRALLRHARDTPSLTHNFPCFAVGVVDAVSGVQRRHNNAEDNSSSRSSSNNKDVAHTHGADFDACVALFRTHVLHTLYTPCDDVKHNDSHTTMRTTRHVNTSNSSSSGDDDDDDVHAVSCASTRMRELRRRLGNAHNVSVFAFSYVYDVLHSDEQQQPQQQQGDSVVSVWRMADVAAAGAAQCRGLGKHTAAATATTAGSWRHEYTCMYYAYVYALLHHGYGLPASRRIHVASKLGGLETTWALGAALRFFAHTTTAV